MPAMLRDAYASAIGAGRSADVMGAAGMVWRRHELGMLLQRLRADATPAMLAEAHRAMVRRLRGADVRRDGIRSDVIVTDALTWWLDPKCRTCGGVQWRVQNARLTGTTCHACAGSGLRPLAGQAQAWVVSQIEHLVSASEDAHSKALG